MKKYIVLLVALISVASFYIIKQTNAATTFNLYLPFVGGTQTEKPSIEVLYSDFPGFIMDYRIVGGVEYILTLNTVYQNGIEIVSYKDRFQGTIPDDLYTDETGFQSLEVVGDSLILFMTEEGVTNRTQSVIIHDLASPDIQASGQVYLKYWSHIHASHLGGMLKYHQGYLYLTTGDGAPQGDPDFHAQDDQKMLGSLLRFRFPTQNTTPGSACPFLETDIGYELAGTWNCGALVRGLRHVWRYEIVDNNFYLGDVGWSQVESIYKVPVNLTQQLNAGWPCLEGSLPIQPTSGCQAGTPLNTYIEYDRTTPHAIDSLCAIVGVHRVEFITIAVDFCGGILYYDSAGNKINKFDYDQWWNFSYRDGDTLYLISFEGFGSEVSTIYSIQLPLP